MDTKPNFERLPLPASFREQSDDQEQIETTECGRIRSYPHVRGQWSTFAFADVPLDTIDDMLDLIRDISGIELVPSESIHLSLVRGHYALRHHQIETFINELSKKLRQLSPFPVCLSTVKLFHNDEETRHFVCLCESLEKLSSNFHKSSRKIIKLIEETLDLFRAKVNVPQSCQVNDCDDFVFHTSVAWCLPDHKHVAERLVETLSGTLDEPIIVRIDRVKVKIGNQMHIIPLMM